MSVLIAQVVTTKSLDRILYINRAYHTKVLSLNCALSGARLPAEQDAHQPGDDGHVEAVAQNAVALRGRRLLREAERRRGGGVVGGEAQYPGSYKQTFNFVR